MAKKKNTSTNKQSNTTVGTSEDQAIDTHAYQPSEDNKNETVQVETSKDERGNRPARRKVYERPSATQIPRAITEAFARDGYELRLTRWAIRGEPDYRYLNRREQEGYEFVTHEELERMDPSYVRTMRIRDTQVTKGLVTNGGDLCLMKIDSDLRKSRQEFYNDEAKNELNSVDIHVLEKKGLRNVGSRSKVMMKEPSFQG